MGNVITTLVEAERFPNLGNAYLFHVGQRAGLCTCYGDGYWNRKVKCRRGACTADAQVCGGYCRPCFDRVMKTAGLAGETPVVTLCGSTKFKEEFERETLRLAREGVIVISVSCFGHSGDLTPEECEDGHPVKVALDELHKRKIDKASRILVINPGGYIGASTQREIEYAQWFDKPIDYLVEP